MSDRRGPRKSRRSRGFGEGHGWPGEGIGSRGLRCHREGHPLAPLRRRRRRASGGGGWGRPLLLRSVSPLHFWGSTASLQWGRRGMLTWHPGRQFGSSKIWRLSERVRNNAKIEGRGYSYSPISFSRISSLLYQTCGVQVEYKIRNFTEYLHRNIKIYIIIKSKVCIKP
jgi:hypothetical protein